jgi:hypothetical protein
MANDTVPNFWDPQLMQGALSPQEKALRDLFVTEYLKDGQAFQAALRCGFIKSIAAQYAEDLMACPYVQKKISEHQAEIRKDPALYQEQLKQQMHTIAMNPYTPAPARVAALAQLMKLEGMGVEKETTDDKEMALINAFKEFATKAPV